jgi:hypothetical protein
LVCVLAACWRLRQWGMLCSEGAAAMRHCCPSTCVTKVLLLRSMLPPASAGLELLEGELTAWMWCPPQACQPPDVKAGGVHSSFLEGKVNEVAVSMGMKENQPPWLQAVVGGLGGWTARSLLQELQRGQLLAAVGEQLDDDGPCAAQDALAAGVASRPKALTVRGRRDALLPAAAHSLHATARRMYPLQGAGLRCHRVAVSASKLESVSIRCR